MFDRNQTNNQKASADANKQAAPTVQPNLHAKSIFQASGLKSVYDGTRRGARKHKEEGALKAFLQALLSAALLFFQLVGEKKKMRLKETIKKKKQRVTSERLPSNQRVGSSISLFPICLPTCAWARYWTQKLWVIIKTRRADLKTSDLSSLSFVVFLVFGSWIYVFICCFWFKTVSLNLLVYHLCLDPHLFLGLTGKFILLPNHKENNKVDGHHDSNRRFTDRCQALNVCVCIWNEIIFIQLVQIELYLAANWNICQVMELMAAARPDIWLLLPASVFCLWAAKSRRQRLSLEGRVCVCVCVSVWVLMRWICADPRTQTPHANHTIMLVQVRIYLPAVLLLGDLTRCRVIHRVYIFQTCSRAAGEILAPSDGRRSLAPFSASTTEPGGRVGCPLCPTGVKPCKSEVWHCRKSAAGKQKKRNPQTGLRICFALDIQPRQDFTYQC